MPNVFRLLPEETVMPDDAPIYFGYIYIVDGIFTRNDVLIKGTVGDWKRRYGHREVRRCEIDGHGPDAHVGDKVDL